MRHISFYFRLLALISVLTISILLAWIERGLASLPIGIWKVVSVESPETSLEQHWRVGQQFELTSDGKLIFSDAADRQSAAYVGSGMCLTPCAEISFLNLDYRLPSHTTYDLSVSDGALLISGPNEIRVKVARK
jgi:hypothetical protein